ncbi:hypothetical protein HZS55_07020 [Halosimplex rubrum]|uniref:Uncharacterized protein n=1 Tax=Halosimplex rubrum TaxID=869889 RepID=A0A7D5P9L2_9EURY|nr:hypothetical protein [Halosimplex rubrum]QLH77059.1 hypothetical protein HZS55_07020 [Halosimplex rubrum]
MDRDQILELVAHYLVIVVIVTVVLGVVRAAVGELGFWLELAVVVVIVAVYRPVVKAIGMEPSAWNRGE